MVVVFCLVSHMVSKFVAVEVTSHQHSPFSIALMPACISITLALPIILSIFLSTTDFCWCVPGALNSKLHPDSVCHIHFGDFCFLHYCQALLFSSQFHIFLTFPLSTLDHFNLVTFLTHEKTVTTITELILCN